MIHIIRFHDSSSYHSSFDAISSNNFVWFEVIVAEDTNNKLPAHDPCWFDPMICKMMLNVKSKLENYFHHCTPLSCF